MCVVSMVADHYRDKYLPWISYIPAEVSRFEFEELKKDVEEMKLLLIRAKKYDEETGQPGCEMAEKIDVLKKVADLVGVDLKDIL